MNNFEKIKEIRKVLDAFRDELCPYCNCVLTPFLNRDEVLQGCNACDLRIEVEDYIHAVDLIITFSENKTPDKFKDVTEF